MANWIRWAFALLVLVLGAVFWLLWSPLPGHPDTGPYFEAAKAYDVEILRDRWGVPHVFGVRDTDAAFGLAYAHAEDDFETIQLTVAATREFLAAEPEAFVREVLVGRFSPAVVVEGRGFRFGRGRVAVSGEAAMFTAQKQGKEEAPFGLNAEQAADNVRFLLNAMHWLDGSLETNHGSSD